MRKKASLLLLIGLLPLFSGNVYSASVLTLADLYRIGLERSERVGISREDLFIARQTREKALSLLMPRVSTFGAYTRFSEAKSVSADLPVPIDIVTQPKSTASWGAKVEQSFTLNGRELVALKIAEGGIERSASDLEAVREEYLFGVAAAFFDLLNAGQLLEIVDADLRRLETHRDAVAARLKLEEVTKTALFRAEAELSGSRTERVRAANALELARAALARIVGLETEFRIEAPEEETRVRADADLDTLKRRALSERPEMRSRVLQREIAQNEVRYTRGAYWPTVSMEGAYASREDEPASSLQSDDSLSVTLRLDFPIFEGGLRRAEVREALARERQARLALDDLRRQIAVEVESAWLDLRTQQSVLESLRDQLRYARENFEAISRQFRFGLSDSLDVMDANTLLVTAERQLSEARFKYQLARIRLSRATGTLLGEIRAMLGKAG